MTVVDNYSDDENLLGKAMALCSDAELNDDGTATGEPTESALVVWANSLGMLKKKLAEENLVSERGPLTVCESMSTVHKTPDGIKQYTKVHPMKSCVNVLPISRTAWYKNN